MQIVYLLNLNQNPPRLHKAYNQFTTKGFEIIKSDNRCQLNNLSFNEEVIIFTAESDDKAIQKAQRLAQKINNNQTIIKCQYCF